MRTSKLKIINDETLEWDVDFCINDKICEKFEVNLKDSKIARQYAEFNLILEDLNLLVMWSKKLKEETDNFDYKNPEFDKTNYGVIKEEDTDLSNRFFSLFSSIISIYGHLFTSGSVLSIPKKFILEKDDKIHNELMNLRHKYIAHREEKLYLESRVFIVINPENKSQFCVNYYSLKVRAPGTQLINEVVEHLQNLVTTIKIKVEKLRVKLYQEYTDNKLSLK